MRFEERVVTPEEAIKWLEERAENRPVSDRVVKDYARQMKEGWWQDTPQGIAFGMDGKLIDGQHRLWAIVESKVSIKLNIIWDSPAQSFHIIDRGQPRSVSFITRVPAFAAQCYTLLLSLVQTESKPAPDDIILMHKLLEGYTQSLMNASNSKLKFFASAPIRSAALISLARGEPPQYILKNWAFISTATTKGSPPVIGSFIETYNRGKLLPTHSGGAYQRKELYLRARYIFDVKNANIDSIPRTYFDTPLASNYFNEINDVVKRALGNHLHPKVLNAQIVLQKKLHPENINNKLTKQLGRLIDAQQTKLSMEANS